MDSARVTETGQREADARNLIRAGFVAMLPLWAGAIPFGIAYSVSARQVGMSLLEIQLMSLTVFAAAVQVSAVALIEIGASTTEILIATVGLNVHLPLLGAAIARELRLAPLGRAGVAYLLTDATYAVAATPGPLRLPFLIGAGISMYLGWNLGTALGLVAGQAIPDPQRYAIDFVVPLTFIAIVVPMVRDRPTLLVASCAATGTVVLSGWLPVGFAILLAGLPACLLGAWLTRDASIPSRRAG